MTGLNKDRRMQGVLQWLEENLDQEPRLSELAEMACYSAFHFHRLFTAFTGESIYAYRKRLLLERAARHLLHGDQALLAVAASCGYENQASFNKAFKQQFACTPMQLRQQKTSIQFSRPAMEIGKKMKVVIVEQEEINIICARATGAYADAAPEAWGRIMRFAYGNRLMAPEVRSFGVSHDDPGVTDSGLIRYDAGLDLSAEISIEGEQGLRRYSIPAGRYAVVRHSGSYENFPQTYHWLFHQWLPESGESLRDEPPFEQYLNRDPRKTKPENLKTDVFLPLV